MSVRREHPFWFRLLMASALGLLLHIPAGAQTPTDEQVTAAIAAGLGGKAADTPEKMARASVRDRGKEGGGYEGFTVHISGPLNRIQAAAYDRGKQYKPFTGADVDEGMRKNVIVIQATPEAELLSQQRRLRDGSAADEHRRPRQERPACAAGAGDKDDA